MERGFFTSCRAPHQPPLVLLKRLQQLCMWGGGSEGRKEVFLGGKGRAGGGAASPRLLAPPTQNFGYRPGLKWAVWEGREITKDWVVMFLTIVYINEP